MKLIKTEENVKYVKIILILISIHPCMLTAGEANKPIIPLSGPIAVHVLEKASPACLKQVIAQLTEREAIVRQFVQETPADKERRNSLSTIGAKIAQDTTKDPQKFKKLMRELSRISRKQNARMEEADADREIETAAESFTQESLKAMIEQVQNSEEYTSFLLEIQMPKQEERQQLWEQATKLLDDQPLQDEALIELIEKTTEHLELLANSLAICARTFPAKMDCLKLPNRQKK